MADFWYEKTGKNKDIVRVVLSGALDTAGCDYLLNCVEHQIKNDVSKLIIDCSKLSYISSMGLGTLVRVNSRMKNKGGDVKIADVPGSIAKVLAAVSLDKVFQMYPTVEAAVEAHGG